MRPLFYEYPDEKSCWEVEDEYFYGPDLLVAPVCYAKQEKRKVYLPGETIWVEYETKKEYPGQQWVEVDTPIDRIPVFCKKQGTIM